ncbi:MAG: hypothetical protein M2R45_02966 [Verrucomicrobia subdivision 3 bacterium]|nr:hypothetical protein [Limisphaerales bacterium]MCS1415314.1 hypothetical protein [Limisphaerales bacterium]
MTNPLTVKSPWKIVSRITPPKRHSRLIVRICLSLIGGLPLPFPSELSIRIEPTGGPGERLDHDFKVGLAKGCETGKPLIVLLHCPPLNVLPRIQWVGCPSPQVVSGHSGAICPRLTKFEPKTWTFRCFQFDPDLSSAMSFINIDKTVYGCFNSRSDLSLNRSQDQQSRTPKSDASSAHAHND